MGVGEEDLDGEETRGSGIQREAEELGVVHSPSDTRGAGE